MSRLLWRWEEKDLGFRFRSGAGKRAQEFYQARRPGEFYVVPASQRKLDRSRIDTLAEAVAAPTSPIVVANPWQHYDHDWDWVATEDGICLNWAGCLEKEELDRREDEGVQRAMELVAELVQRPTPMPLNTRLIQQAHIELMGSVYPFAGQWRTVSLHKGNGPTRWPLPPGGIQPLMDVLERDVLSRSPLVSDDDEEVFGYAAEVMCELLALHPFREGNGRTAFIVGNLILMQNSMLPLTTYERRSDEMRYLAACEAGRLGKQYGPLAMLLMEWEDRAVAQWRSSHE
ncbi:MAG: Fic family protein [Burkholderiales bacterium]|nr:Fic family protein [Burkholderiales bacterium]